jgi:predicted alpha/beta-hydrolase family hydrolase
MRHPFLERAAVAFGAHGVATYRYEFPYMRSGKHRPDPPAVAEAAVREAAAAAARVLPGVPLLAGGKSFGGRMTSQAQAKQPLPGVRGLVFLGFPLHAPGRPATTRGEHLAAVQVPMLFLQGTRDEFAQLDLLEPIVQKLGSRATLHLVEEGDHSFKVPKRTGKTEVDVMNDLAGAIAQWATGL